ncbi:MAG: ATP-binding cassette domain-containing protein [Steroidobacteraceae bacterium]
MEEDGGYVSPDLQADYVIDVSIRDMVISGRHASIGLNERADADDIAAVRYWIRHFDLEEFIHRRPRELSYGQLRRALLARAMAAAPRLLLLDEPFTGLDAAQRAAMRSMLDGLMARGVTVVMAVHHAEDLPAGITHVLHLHKRRAHARALRTATRIPGG